MSDREFWAIVYRHLLGILNALAKWKGVEQASK